MRAPRAAGGDGPDGRTLARVGAASTRRRGSAASACTSSSPRTSNRARRAPRPTRSSSSSTGPVSEIASRLGTIEDAKTLAGLLLYLQAGNRTGKVRPLEDRRRQGDQVRRVPRRADACGRARARATRPRGDRRDGRGRRELVPRRRVQGRRRAHRLGRRRLGGLRAPAEGEGADRAGVRPAARRARALHVPAHRRRRAAHARARRQRDHGRRLRDRRDRRPARCRCSRR